MKEEWIDVKDYEGFYKVSNKGRVKSLKRLDRGGKRIKERIMKFTHHTNGYYYLSLRDKITGLIKTYSVHSIVIRSFLGYSTLEINHIDGIKTNNKLNNLEYVTSKQNKRHAIELGLTKKRGEDHHNSKLNISQVKKIRKLYKTGNFIQAELSKMFSISLAQINRIINNKRWGGYEY